MNDTSPWAEARLAELYARRTPGERIAMACEMFALARQMMIAGIRAEHPAISPLELRLMVLERTYAGDFRPDQWAQISARLRGDHPGSHTDRSSAP